MTIRTQRALVPGLLLAAASAQATEADAEKADLADPSIEQLGYIVVNRLYVCTGKLRYNKPRNGRLPNPVIPAYYETDMHWRWKLSPNMDMAPIGRNLLHRSHIGFDGPNGRSSYERTALVKVTWRY